MAEELKVAIDVRGITVSYNGIVAVRNVTLPIYENHVLALIGPSGCGKSSFARSLNDMNRTLPNSTVHTEGDILLHGQSIFAKGVRPERVRTVIGMVFQRANPLASSIYKNVSFGPWIAGIRDKATLDEIVEESLKQASLWREVKDKLHSPATDLSVGQQQRMCIARALALKPKVLIFDESTSNLDPITSRHIGNLIKEKLVGKYTIIIVSHDLEQARSISNETAFFDIVEAPSTEIGESRRWGEVIEHGSTELIFSRAAKDPRTREYVKRYSI